MGTGECEPRRNAETKRKNVGKARALERLEQNHEDDAKVEPEPACVQETYQINGSYCSLSDLT